ncbi:uncharacterized protein DNG_03586 [Cephalotrichum gorgonifer]|uniref:Uncharacterized protein n=1 Tax=Cephalotrichum gorgonifer TaxID=2041049 RepID=A0AAE8STQ6_9PEZI|nr:uncharacterized protein DNG_03586 [Cephalotrichum gorgonifer]
MAPKKSKKDALVAKWQRYFEKGDLEDWQRLCSDLGLRDDLPSKTKCRAVASLPPFLPVLPPALKSVNVNIVQFLSAESKPEDVQFFGSKKKLYQYTSAHDAFYPRNRIEQGGPLRSLLKMF